MSDSVIQVIGYCAIAIIAVWVLSLFVRYVRENAPERPERRPWLLQITLTHRFPEGAFLAQLAAIVQEMKHTTVVHEVGEQTFDDTQRFMDGLLGEWFEARRKERENIPAAQQFTMPPEPEERIARDLKNAKALMRGATQLMGIARERGLTLSQEDAMRQAADMLYQTLDADDPR